MTKYICELFGTNIYLTICFDYVTRDGSLLRLSETYLGEI